MCLFVLLAVEETPHHTHTHSHSHAHLSWDSELNLGEETFALMVEPGQIGLDSKNILQQWR